MINRRKIKRIISLLIVFVMTIGMHTVTFADEASVTFENGKVFEFEPGSIYSGTDLFRNFKDIMPGDKLSEEITIKNSSDDFDYIKVYLKAVAHDKDRNPLSKTIKEAGETIESMEDFLSQLSMKVYNGGEEIYNQSPDKVGNLKEPIYLGNLRKSEELKLNVELEVPIELANEYMDRLGEVDWNFIVEGFDESKLTVRKIWEDKDSKRPASIKVNLLKDGKVQSEIELNEENQWIYTFDKLSEEFKWTAKEVEVPEGYEVSYKADETTFIITNIGEEKPEEKPGPDLEKPALAVDLTVKILWDDRGRARPDSIVVNLYNGDALVDTIKLSDLNNWTYKWRNLSGDGNWQVVESSIPNGYTPSYKYKDGLVIITNTASLIQTGQLNCPIIIFGGLGILMIIIGLIISKKRINHDV